MGKINYYAMKEFSTARLVTAGVLAVFPGIEMLGIHDLILKRYLEALLHIELLIMTLLVVAVAGVGGSNGYSGTAWLAVSWVLMMGIPSGLFLWSLVEGILIFCSIRRPIENPGSDSDAATTTNKKSNPGTAPAVLAIIASVIPILIWVFCLINSAGSFNENGPGAVWWLLVMYYWTIGFPLAIIAVVLGIYGYVKGARVPATIALALKGITILIIAFIFFR